MPPSRTLLDADAIAPALAALPGWTKEGGAIRKTFTSRDFLSAVGLITRIAVAAERADHHPDLNLHDWNKLTITLSTHSAGGITGHDVALAAEIEKINAA
jgi:4a-hydroxytetrahydrobiopterin dehydratase